MVKPKRCDGGCGKAMPKRGKFCEKCKFKNKQVREYQRKY